jgi:hypothetical protein
MVDEAQKQEKADHKILERWAVSDLKATLQERTTINMQHIQ